MTQRRAQTFQAVSENAVEVEDSIARVIASWGAVRPDLNVNPIAVTARVPRLQAEIGPRLEMVFERFGVRGADFAILATLVRLAGETVSQRRLGSELRLSPGTVSLRIDRLVRRGLIVREPDPDDGRGAVISITYRGRELFEACAPEHLANAEELLAGLSDDEREQLGRLLGKLLYTLEAPGPDDPIAAELGLVVEDAPIALERRRAVGLPPLAGLLVSHVDPAGPAAATGIRPGDLLTAANRRTLRTRHDLQVVLAHTRGRRRAMALEVTRGTEPIRLSLAASHRGGHGARL
jgi:DNA-binding MarR family transcriptional regulator